jgi:hypothetical protein
LPHVTHPDGGVFVQSDSLLACATFPDSLFKEHRSADRGFGVGGESFAYRAASERVFCCQEEYIAM